MRNICVLYLQGLVVFIVKNNNFIFYLQVKGQHHNSGCPVGMYLQAPLVVRLTIYISQLMKYLVVAKHMVQETIFYAINHCWVDRLGPGPTGVIALRLLLHSGICNLSAGDSIGLVFSVATFLIAWDASCQQSGQWDCLSIGVLWWRGTPLAAARDVMRLRGWSRAHKRDTVYEQEPKRFEGLVLKWKVD